MDFFKPRVESYLPPLPAEQRSKYTLVLDLDETLVHSTSDLSNPDGSGLQVRPGAVEFVEELADYYELVIFTAGTQDYADWALRFVDPKQRIAHRLYREHAVQKGSVFVKDVSKLGRDLRKVIIIDNIVDNFQLQPENGIFINTWEGDMNDSTLFQLAPVLKQIVLQKILDVRIALRHYRDYQMRCMLSQQKPKYHSYS